MTDKELLQLAKEALLDLWSGCPNDQEIIEAINERLVQPEKEWVGLTDDAEILAISHTMPYANRFEFARAIEAKLKEKNSDQGRKTKNL